jgi:hypothetical protein
VWTEVRLRHDIESFEPGLCADLREVVSGDLIQVDDAGRNPGIGQALVLLYRRCDLVEDSFFESYGLRFRSALDYRTGRAAPDGDIHSIPLPSWPVREVGEG